jgi:hypothetical protein
MSRGSLVGEVVKMLACPKLTNACAHKITKARARARAHSGKNDLKNGKTVKQAKNGETAKKNFFCHN